MSQLYTPPELEPDPEFRDYEPINPEPGWKSLLRRLWAPIAAVIGLAVKFGVFTLKFFGLFVSIAAYGLIWGWKFGVGFVLMITIHELGHFAEARRQGLKVSLPRFVPFIGAYVVVKDSPQDPWRNALVALAGPAAGGLASAACWVIGVQTGSDFLQALAYTAFFLNLFNLIPIGILDGGVIWRSYKLAKAEAAGSIAPVEADTPLSIAHRGRAAVEDAVAMVPGAGRGRAPAILTLYIGLVALLVLGMWATHVPQHRL